MSIDWMQQNDKSEVRLEDLSPEEQLARVRQRTQIEADDSMFSGGGEQPWHLPWIGTQCTVVEDRLTAQEALAAAGLDWEVEKRPVFAGIPKPKGRKNKIAGYTPVPRYFAITRKTDDKPLGIVKQRYTILQNADAFDWANFMVGGDGAHFETAGSLKGGRVVYVTIKTPFKVDLPGGDKLETYTLISNNHDGSGSVTAAIVTVRVVCANTLSRSINGAKGVYRIRHTLSLPARMSQAQHVLGLAQGAANRAEAIATKLLSQKMTEQKFNAFLDLLLKPELAEEPTPRQLAAVERKRATIEEVYSAHPTQQEIRGTAWGAYNAVTFYNDHLIPRREMGEESEGSQADQRMLGIMAGDNLGDKALEVLMDGIGGGRWLTGRKQ